MLLDLWDTINDTLGRIGSNIGLAVIDNDFRVVKANHIHHKHFPGVDSSESHCYHFCNLFERECSWCPVKSTFQTGQIAIGSHASPDPNDAKRTDVIYTQIVALPYEWEDEDNGRVKTVLEVIFYVSDEVRRGSQKHRELHQRASKYGEFLERIRADSYLPEFILFGAISRHVLDMDEAMLLIMQDRSVPSESAKVARARQLRKCAATAEIDASFDHTASAAAIPETRAKLMVIEKSFEGEIPRLGEEASVARWLSSLAPDFGRSLSKIGLEDTMLISLPFRMSPQSAAAFISPRGQGPYALLIVRRTRHDDEVSPLILDSDLVDLSLYGAFVSQALTARYHSAVFLDAARRVGDTLSQYESEPQALIFAAGLAAGYAHDMLTACAKIKSLAEMVVQFIPKTERDKDRVSVPLQEFMDRVEFVRLCGQAIGNVARTADPSRVVRRKRSLYAIVRSVYTSFSPSAKAQGIQMKYSVPRSPVAESSEVDLSLALCDELLMRMVFGNLLQNAVYWVKGIKGRPPVISVSGSTSATHVIIKVRDNGIGIDPDMINHIWEPFYSGRRSDEGMGLGLFLARRIVTELHGGRSTVESSRGYWTEFTVSIPKATT